MIADDLQRQADAFIDLADLAEHITRRQVESRQRAASGDTRPMQLRATPAKPFSATLDLLQAFVGLEELRIANRAVPGVPPPDVSEILLDFFNLARDLLNLVVNPAEAGGDLPPGVILGPPQETTTNSQELTSPNPEPEPEPAPFTSPTPEPTALTSPVQQPGGIVQTTGIAR